MDIEIEKCLENCKDDQLLSQCEKYEKERDFILDSFDLSESTKVSDYLNQVRMRTIEILRNGQNESLENLKSKSFNSDKLKEAKNIDEFKSHLFSDKFYFQVVYKSCQRKKWVFNLFTFVTDFYISSSDIDLLEYNYFN